MITIVLADDHPIIRQGLRGVLEGQPDIQVIGEAANGQEAVQITERLKPNVVIVDLMMPGLSGLDVTRLLHKRAPATRSLIFSMYQDEAYVVQAMKNGASGYVLKESLASDILLAVREVVAGHRYLSPPLTDRAIDFYVERLECSANDPCASLSDREREVLHMIVEGTSNKAIGVRLGLSVRTVETHRLRLMRKLGVRSQAELIQCALRNDLFPLED